MYVQHRGGGRGGGGEKEERAKRNTDDALRTRYDAFDDNVRCRRRIRFPPPSSAAYTVQVVFVTGLFFYSNR